MATRDQGGATTAVLLLGGGAAGYALGRFVLGRRHSADAPKFLHDASMAAARAAIPAALVGIGGSAGLPVPVASAGVPPASGPRTASPSAPVLRPRAPATNTPARTAPKPPTTTAATAGRPTVMPATRYTPMTPPSATEPSVAGPPPSAYPIDPYAEPSPSTTPHVPVRPPVTAVPMDPYATPSHPAVTRPATTGPITSPSQLDDPASTALAIELADALTASPSLGSRLPALPSASIHTGPITSPAQVETPTPTRPIELEIGPVTVTPAPTRAVELEIGPATVQPSRSPVPIPSSALPRRFDGVFERYRGSIPIEYLRSLVARESSFQVSARTGSAIGLMQIIPVVLDDYNKRHGTAYQRERLVDPIINVAIGCELLRLIIASYRRNHPRVPNLQENWSNPRFAELLTFGWNAGFSEAGGVGRVARYLEAHGTVDITIELVHEQARAAGASKHLATAGKVRWSKSVVALYLRERAASAVNHVS